jgi:hypothetical protein
VESTNINWFLRSMKVVRDHSQVLQPTLSGQMDRSATLRFFTPWTFKRSSRTPCLTMLFPSLGAMEQVYSSLANMVCK